MKKILLSFCLLLSYTYSQAQIIVYAESPPSVAGNYNFTWAPPSGGWGTPDLNIPANAITDTLMLVDDGTSADSLGCNTLINNLTGKIAVVYRGACEFGVKAFNAQNAGAVGVIIINNVIGAPVGMAPGSQGANVTIPVVMISDDDGAVLRAEIDAGSDVVVFIGNKVGLFNNDLGYTAIDILIPRATANPALVSLSPTEFNVPLGAWIHNYGINNQTGVTLTVDITGADTYSATSAPVLINSGDSAYITVTTYSALSYSGLYHVNYKINYGVPDDFIADNIFYANFFIDSLASYAFIDSVTELPVSSAHYRPGPATIFQECIHFRDSNASRLAALGLYASASGGAGGTMVGEYLEARIYQWNNVFTGLSDPALPVPPTPFTLNQITSGPYTYSADLQREMVYIPFNDTLILIDNQRYLFCVLTYSPDVYLGFDAYYDYTEVINYNDQPVAPILSDNNHYAVGFGTDVTSSVSVLFASGNIQFTAAITAMSEPFCGPGCDGWATASASLGIPPYSYLWNDPLVQTTATATGLCNGTYLVIVSDNAGAVDTLTVTLNPPVTPPVAVISGNALFCFGDSIMLTAGTQPSATYLWSTGETTQSIYADTAKTYTLYITNCAGADTTDVTTSFEPLPTITVTVTGPVTFCHGTSSVVLTASGGVSYLWSDGSAQQTRALTDSTQSGNYWVTAYNVCGDSAISGTTTVTIHPLPPVPTISATGITFCTGDSVTLTSSAATGNQWYRNASPISIGGTNQIYVAIQSGDYTVTVTDINGCSAFSSDTITLTVSATPSPYITISGNTTFCEGDSVILTSTYADSYLWSPGGDTTQSITVYYSGDYFVYVTNTDLCDGIGNSSSVLIIVYPKPQTSNITGIANVSEFSISNYSVSFHVGSIYYWSIVGGNQINGGQTNSIGIQWGTSGTGQINVVEKDSMGCFGDTVSLIVDISTGIDESDFAGEIINIHPNPNNGQFIIELNNVKKENGMIEVRNIIGQLIYTEDINKISGDILKIDHKGFSTFTVNLSEHNRGVYFLSISNLSEIKTAKLIVY